MSRNRYFSHLLSTVVIVFLTGLAFAQQASTEVAPPREPVLSRAGQRAEWTVEISYDPAAATSQFINPKGSAEAQPGSVPPSEPAFRPVKIRVSKDGKMYREVTTWSDGSSTQKWLVDGMQIREVPRTGQLARVDMTSYSESFSDYRRSDFEPLEWVSMDNYKGARTVKGVVAYEFQSAADKKKVTPREKFLHSGGNEEASAGANDAIAYLDVNTQMPLFVKNNGVVMIYKDFSSGVPLSVPENFAMEFQKWKDHIAKRTRVPTPP